MPARPLDRGDVLMVLVGGPPGAGKTTLAVSLGAALGAVVIATDDVRRELADLHGRDHRRVRSGVYPEVLRRARAALALGNPVILDATWASRRRREQARMVARRAAVDLVEVLCVAPRDVAVKRVAGRWAQGAPRGTSEVTPEVAGQVADQFEAWPEAWSVDTSRSEQVAVGTILNYLG